MRDLIAAAASDGDIRDDFPADELAAYTLNALSAASQSTSKASVRRLLSLTLDGLRAL